MGLVRSPNGDDSDSDSSGAMRKPSAGRFSPADATLSWLGTPSFDVVSTVDRVYAMSAKASAVKADEATVPALELVGAPVVPGSRTPGPTTPAASDGEGATAGPVPDRPWTPKVRTASERQKPPDKQRTAVMRALTARSLDEFP
jgi:hypothetical protein